MLEFAVSGSLYRAKPIPYDAKVELVKRARAIEIDMDDEGEALLSIIEHSGMRASLFALVERQAGPGWQSIYANGTFRFSDIGPREAAKIIANVLLHETSDKDF
jgi:hypothetical protein